jgi:carbamoyltransferase
LSATVSIGKKGKIERLSELEERFSLARLYAMLTFKLGMVPLEHEYKLMGMAPYGNEIKYTKPIKDIFYKIYNYSEGDNFWKPTDGKTSIYDSWTLLEDELRFKRFDHISAALQEFTEEITLQWIEGMIKKTGIKNIVLGGGIFMNVKMNKKILESNSVEKLFIFPSCGDESNSIGACYLKSFENGIVPEKLNSLYLGFSSSTVEVESTINEAKNLGILLKNTMT